MTSSRYIAYPIQLLICPRRMRRDAEGHKQTENEQYYDQYDVSLHNLPPPGLPFQKKPAAEQPAWITIKMKSICA